MRTTACFRGHLHLIAPLGFILSDKHLKRAHMDYDTLAHLTVHNNWTAFIAFFKAQNSARLVGITPDGSEDYTKASYSSGDFLLVGSESTGLKHAQKEACALTVRIPMAQEARSLNVAIAAAMVMGEFLRQTHLFP